MGMAIATCVQATPEKASSYYEDALKRYEKTEMPAAIIQLKNALQQDSKMLAAHLLLGKALLRNGDLKGAEAAFEEALKQGVNRGEVALPLGQVYLALGRPEAVIEKISASGLSPALQVEVFTMRGNAYLESGKPIQATQSFENARAVDPKSASPLIAEVPMLLAAGRLDKAREKAIKAVELAPNSADAWNAKASVLHAALDAPGAISAYDRALSLSPRNVDARISRSALLIDLKRDSAALEDLEYLKTVAADEPRAAYLRAVLAGQKGDSNATNEALKEVTRTVDALPPAWLLRREQLLMSGALAHYGLASYEKSREYLDAIISRSPNNLAARKLLAAVYVDTKDFGRAQPLLESLQRATPEDPQVLFMLGSVNLAQKRYAQASNLLERAASRTGSPEMNRSLGFSQLGLGQAEKGLVNLEKSFAANPSDTRTGMALATLYMRHSKPEKALKIAEAMFKRDPSNLTLQNFLGSLKGASGDRAGARFIYTQVLARDVSFVPAALNLARLDASEKRFDEARHRLDGLLKKDSNDYQVLFEYGMIELRAGRHNDAIRYLTKAGSVQRTDPNPTLALIELLLNQRLVEPALAAAKDLAGKFSGNLNVQLALVRTYLANGDAANAKVLLTGATRLAAFNARTQVAIARLQLAASNPDGAAYSVQKALQGNPGDISALSLAVQIETLRRDTAKANAALSEMSQRYPAALETLRTTADLSMARGEFANAIAGYRKLLAREEKTGNALALSNAYGAAGEFGKAAAFLEGWVKSHPNDLNTMKALAETQFRAGQLVAARNSYQRIIAIDAEDASLFNNYANLLLQLNDPAAQEAAERAFNLAPRQPAYADTLGWILVSKGQIEGGLRYLREARLRNPDNADIRVHLAHALTKAGRKEEARLELSAALSASSPVSNTAIVGQLKKELGMP